MIGIAKPFTLSKPSQLPEHANIVIGGVAGSGKTSLLGLVGRGNKALIIDTEGGTSSFNNPWFKAHEAATEQENLDIVSIPTGLTPTNLVHEVESVLDYIIRTKNSDGYKLVALDSITEMQALFIAEHQASDGRQAYGDWGKALHTIVHKARQAPVHTVFTARLKADFDEVLNREIVRPAVSPGAWSSISGLFDAIGYLDVKQQGIKVSRVLNFELHIRTQGKDRLGIGALVEPTFVDIMERLDANGSGPAVPSPTPPRTPAPRRGAAVARSQA